MRYTTRGIVLHYMKYRETSIIVRIFTEMFGKQSFIVQGVRAAKPKHPIALFQPLVPLDMVIYLHKHATLQRIVEIKCHLPISSILGDLKKATIATFLTELLHKVLYEEEQNVRLFDFLLKSVARLDQLTTNYELFYLDFMLQLCTYLGFGCTQAAEINTQLIRSGVASPFNAQEINLLDQLLHQVAPQHINASKQSMRNVLASIVRYFQLHVDTLDTLKSLPVLQEVSG